MSQLWTELMILLWEAITLAKGYLFETCLLYIVVASFYISLQLLNFAGALIFFLVVVCLVLFISYV
jgi:hypothetical protein